MKTPSNHRWWLAPTFIVLLGAALLWVGPLMAGVKPAYLITDQLLWGLIGALIYGVAYIVHQEHLLRPWRQVFQSRVAVLAAVVMGAYAVVGLLDSVHYRAPLPTIEGQDEQHFSARVDSLLDLVMQPIRSKVEKSYSAPFAVRLFTKETQDRPDGSRTRVRPRLTHGGAHLEGVEQRARDMAWRSARAVAEATVTWLVVVFITAWRLRRRLTGGWGSRLRQVLTRGDPYPWHVALWSLLAIILMVFLAARLGPYYHIFGTDKVGQDVFYQSIKSIRTGLVIGTLTTLVMLPFAVLLGIAAGYFRKLTDDIIQYLYTTLNSIPGVLLIAAAILSIQVYIANHPELFETGAERADLRLLALCIILGVTSWTGLCRLLRGETLKLGRMDFVEAASAFGVRDFTILGRHILPNVMHIVLIIVVLDFSGLVLAEAVLSYIGVGVDPSTISWGNMINRARLEMAREPVVWWSLSAAFVFMFTLVLAANLFSDAVRDAFDPRLRQSA